MPLYPQPLTAGRLGYACKAGSQGGCGCIQIDAEPLEVEVAAQCLARLASPRIRTRIEAAAGIPADSATKELHARALALANTMAELADAFHVRKVISQPEYLSARAQLNAQLSQVQEPIAAADTRHVLPDLSPDGLIRWGRARGSAGGSGS
jgi:inorganic triphosphatase YgiF